MSAKVSICIPTYKQVKYLRKTLMSILEQTYSDYEIVVTDDSPDDSVKSLLKEFDFKGKLHYYKNESALGSPENWNEGLRKATGKYIKPLHHDDFFVGEFALAEFVNMLDRNPDADFGFCSSIIVDGNTEEISAYYPSAISLQNLKKLPENLFMGNKIGAPSATIFRKNDLTFDNKLKWLVDLEFYIRYLNKNKNFAFNLRPLIATTNNAGHQVTSESLNNKNIELFENLYVYNKLMLDYTDRIALIDHFKLLFHRFGIKSKKDIEKEGLSDFLNLPLFKNESVFQYKPKGLLSKYLLPEKINYL